MSGQPEPVDPDKKVTKVIEARHPQACLELLPEEILQYIYAYITAPPYPANWLL